MKLTVHVFHRLASDEADCVFQDWLVMKLIVCVFHRLASSNTFMVTVLGIKNPVHKQKLALKAMDTVLFGAPPSECRQKHLSFPCHSLVFFVFLPILLCFI